MEFILTLAAMIASFTGGASLTADEQEAITQCIQQRYECVQYEKKPVFSGGMYGLENVCTEWTVVLE